MSKYIEEYLVSLGFEVDSGDYKKYEKDLDDLEKKNKDLLNQGKTSEDQAKKQQKNQKQKLDDGKKEIDMLGELEKSMRQILGLAGEIGEGNIFGALLRGSGTAKYLKDFFGQMGQSEKPKDKEKTEEPAKKKPSDNAPEEPPRKRAEVNTPTPEPPRKTPAVTQPKDTTQKSSFSGAKDAAKGALAGAAEDKAIRAGITGVAAGEGATAGLAGAAAVAAPVALTAALVAGAVAAEKMADNLSKTQINIETMARQLWITDDYAWQLNNTLNAMGKTTADLNEIALNPTLRRQYQDLMKYQKDLLQMPADFKQVNDEWANSVGTSNQALKETLANTKMLMSYKLEKTFAPIMTGLNLTLTAMAKLFQQRFGLNSENTAPSENQAAATVPAYSPSSFAPQSYTTNNGGSVQVYNQFDTRVTAQSSEPHEIAQETANSIAENFGYQAYINKYLQNPSR